ncbi:hypothetical protein [Congregicoccus parvus]|uniref:hypothetical protein n=1 Tax=Congregicoccus parvus TaxID=3081749 RepID=UPI003FA5DE9E
MGVTRKRCRLVSEFFLGQSELVSPDVVIPLVFGAFFLATVMLGISSAARGRKRTHVNLLELANRLGLTPEGLELGSVFRVSRPELRGSYRGRRIRVFSYTTGSGKNRTQWCAIATEVANRTGMSLRISRENFFTRAGRRFGIDDVQIGDANFDRDFYVKSDRPEYLRAAMIPEIRHRLQQVWVSGTSGSLSVEGAELRYAEIGSFSDASKCRRLADFADSVCDLGDVIEAAL